MLLAAGRARGRPQGAPHREPPAVPRARHRLPSDSRWPRPILVWAVT